MKKKKRALESPEDRRPKRSRHTFNEGESCFFCGDIEGVLVAAKSQKMSSRVKACAMALGKASLVEKLAISDMHTNKSVYHKKCLANLYNETRCTSRVEAEDISSTPVEDEPLILSKAANIVRKAMFIEEKNEYDDKMSSLSMSSEQNTIPSELLTLIKLILVGTKDNSEANDLGNRANAAITICQLICFNSKKKKAKQVGHIRYCREKETAIPLYNALKIHASTRNRELIDRQHQLGLSISYPRTLRISNELAKSICQRYKQEGIVCPPNLPKGVFTTSAIDNLDHDPTSNFSDWSFHGTAISLTCHNSDEYQPDNSTLIPTSADSSKTFNLPEEFTFVSPFHLKNKSPVVPSSPSISKQNIFLENYEKVTNINNFDYSFSQLIFNI